MARKAKRIPEFLTPEEIERLFRAIDSVRDSNLPGKRERDRAMFRLAYHRGLRASELGMIQYGDYRAKEGRIMIRRLKGSNSGEYCMTRVEHQALRSWIRKRGTDPGPLFGSRNHRPVSRKRLDQLMKIYCQAAGIGREKAHMHSLKHSCGTHLSAREADIVAIQDHLGHANIQNTMKYVQITSRRRDQFADRLMEWS